MHELPGRRRLGRRTLLSTGGVGLVGAGALLYQAAPGFWQQYTREFKRPVTPSPRVPNPRNWPDRGIYGAWLGHSTVLLKIDGTTILTDPVFSTRAGLHLGIVTLGVKRMVAPALDRAGLPPIDLILLSHAHMDHFDIPSLRRLEDRRTSVITAAKTSDLLRVGQIVLNGGRWGEQQLVPADWLQQCLTVRTRTTFGLDYGYQWYRGRTGDLTWFAGNGNGGQHLFVAPELDLTFVCTAGNYNQWDGPNVPIEVQKLILAALR